MKTASTAGSIDHFVLGLLLLSLGGNVYLGVKALRPLTPTIRPSGPSIGATLGAFEAHDVQGNAQVVDARAERTNTVFYVFSPSCVWCERNLSNLRAIADRAGARYKLIGVSLDPKVTEYVAAKQITFPVIVSPSAKTIAAYGLGATPQTIVVSPAGKVLKVWQGAYAGGAAAEVEEFFDIKLPGLLPSSATP